MDFGLLLWTEDDPTQLPTGPHSLKLRLLKRFFDDVLLEHGGLPYPMFSPLMPTCAEQVEGSF